MFCVPFTAGTAISLLELGFVTMSDSDAVLSVKPFPGLDIVLVLLKNLMLVRNRYFKEVQEYVIFEILVLLTSIFVLIFFAV